MQKEQPTDMEGPVESLKNMEEHVKMVLTPASNQFNSKQTVDFRMAIETYKRLERDFPEETANLLLSVSQMLFKISNGNQPTSTITVPPDEFPAFMPARTIIAANAMTFLSLAFGLATSLVSVVAKIACLLFLLMCRSKLIPQQYEIELLERRLRFLYRLLIFTGLATFVNLWGAVVTLIFGAFLFFWPINYVPMLVLAAYLGLMLTVTSPALFLIWIVYELLSKGRKVETG
ncbi:hypothetical protein FRC11_002647 [Ceratobasidium sp. 423]|nr:hypothetical protein FRC11_002647 [Ceratobasidium sp. 423]